jgi:hypothetical protein
MSKFEYSDLYKFITSFGITLIVVSFFVPWLFLKESFDLLQKQNDIELFTPLAQTIVQSRQNFILVVTKIIPYFSSFTFLLGLTGVIVGVILWFKKTQKPLDRLSQLNVDEMEKKVGSVSEKEMEGRREEEIKVDLESKVIKKDVRELEEKPLTSSVISSLAKSESDIVKRITGLLVTCFAQTHTILTERRLGPAIFDIVMASKTRLYKDHVIDVKYIQKGFHYNWLRENTLRIVYANHIYCNETNRQSIPILCIVGDKEAVFPPPAEKDKYLSRIKSELISLNSEAEVVMLTKNDFYNTDCSKLKALLKL